VPIVVCFFAERQCGQEVGDLMLDLAKAWEMADTSASNNLAKQLPTMAPYLTASAKSGTDLISILSGFCVLCDVVS
jgi:hypothetical protein